ncbi:tetratricopeptide repeat-containing sensor histidine kinase, partial [Sphingobacterium spiritivorum]
MKYFFLFFLSVSLLSCFRKEAKEAKNSTNPYFDKAIYLLEENKLDSAFIYFDKAKNLFLVKNDSIGVAKCLINNAITLTEKGDYFGGQETSLEAVKYIDQNNENQYH